MRGKRPLIDVSFSNCSASPALWRRTQQAVANVRHDEFVAAVVVALVLALVLALGLVLLVIIMLLLILIVVIACCLSVVCCLFLCALCSLLLFIVCCSLFFVVCWSLFLIRCLLFGVRCLFLNACCCSFFVAVYCSFFVVRCCLFFLEILLGVAVGCRCLVLLLVQTSAAPIVDVFFGLTKGARSFLWSLCHQTRGWKDPIKSTAWKPILIFVSRSQGAVSFFFRIIIDLVFPHFLFWNLKAFVLSLCMLIDTP